MTVTERDLFFYVWDQSELSLRKIEYLDNNCDKFQEELGIVIRGYFAVCSNTDYRMILKILTKIKKYVLSNFTNPIDS